LIDYFIVIYASYEYLALNFQFLDKVGKEINQNKSKNVDI